jgi:hypothetical protein
MRMAVPSALEHEGMNEGKTVFSQLIGYLPDRDFRRCVAHYSGDRYAKKLSCWQQFLAMAFAQLTYRESLRDIEACLGAVGPKLYHMGFGCAVARSTLADANESRDWRIFADFAQVLIRTAIQLYANDAMGGPFHFGCLSYKESLGSASRVRALYENKVSMVEGTRSDQPRRRPKKSTPCSFPMHARVTSATQRNEVFLCIIPGLAAQCPMVYLEMRERAATLASPSVPAQ